VTPCRLYSEVHSLACEWHRETPDSLPSGRFVPRLFLTTSSMCLTSASDPKERPGRDLLSSVRLFFSISVRGGVRGFRQEFSFALCEVLTFHLDAFAQSAFPGVKDEFQLSSPNRVSDLTDHQDELFGEINFLPGQGTIQLAKPMKVRGGGAGPGSMASDRSYGFGISLCT
jgi:hypothetical protein